MNDELSRIRGAGDQPDRAKDLAQILGSVTIVEPPEDGSKDIAFGATVTIEAADGDRRTYTVVGVEELDLEPDAVSWVSEIGKAILAAELGDRVTVGDQKLGKIVKVEYRQPKA